jgi:hypothetical protein
MPTVEETLLLVCSLAHDYYTKNMSPHSLLVASGYREHRGVITVEMIKTHVSKNPKLIRDWLSYSEDKRGGSKWFLGIDSASGSFTVGGFPHFDPEKNRKTFSDAPEACAVFIKHELDSIGL